MNKTILLITTTFILALALITNAQPTSAADYFINYAYTGGADCATDGFRIPYRVTWNVPASGGVYNSITEQLNGKRIFTYAGYPAYKGTGSSTGVGFAGGMYTTTKPYTFVVTIVYSLNGVVFNTITITLNCTLTNAIVTIINCPQDCGSSGSTITFFDPKDGRKNGWPGDRVVVWCNLDDRILDVYGVNNEGRGFPLTTFNFKDVVKAGIKGVTKNLGVTGSISLSVDNQNNFWLAWNGGPFNANGQGDWAKGFNCPFKR